MYGPAKKWVALACAGAVLGMLAGSAHAARNGSGKGGSSASSITLEPYSDLRLAGRVGFTTSAVGLSGWEYPMVAVSCYQDVNGDGAVDTHLLGPDIVFTWLDHPDAEIVLGAYSSIWTLRGGGPADCRADLDAYGWKGAHESTRVLDSVSFHAAG